MIIILTLTFVIELLKYLLGLYVCFSVRFKRKWLFFLGVFLYIILILNQEMNHGEAHIIIYVILIPIIFATIEVKGYSRTWSILIIIVILITIDELIGAIIKSLYTYYNSEILDDYISCLLSSCVNILLIICVAVIKRRYKFYDNKKIKHFIRKSINILVLIMAISMIFTIVSFLYIRQYIANDNIAIFITILSILSLFSIALLGVFMIYIKNSNEKMEELIVKEKQLRIVQENYYQTLLEKEEGTRRFRHDLNNHLICLSELAIDKSEGGVKKYVETMQGQLFGVKSNNYQTGNKILDVFINYYTQMLDEDVKINVTGNCMRHMEIDDIDMCIIFSNLLQNAVEAIEREKIDDKSLEIDLKQGKDYLQVQIINTINEDYKSVEKLYTEKLDKENHGFGIKNVHDTVEKNGGKFNIESEKGRFIVKVTLKNKK